MGLGVRIGKSQTRIDPHISLISHVSSKHSGQVIFTRSEKRHNLFCLTINLVTFITVQLSSQITWMCCRAKAASLPIFV